MKVRNMESKSGTVVNQFIIEDNDKIVFQSYSSAIVMKKGGKIYLDKDKWDYSKTTGKYRNLFLGETKKETEKKIASGEYILTNLN